MHRGMKLTVLVVAAALLLLAAGCAKKKVQVSGPEAGAGAEATMGQEGQAAEEGAEQAGQVTEKGPSMEEYELTEEERRAKMEAEERKKAKEKQLKKERKAALKERIHFAFDSYELSQAAREKLKQKAEILQNHPEIDVVIEGHCDERGTDEYNLALGERRARAAYEYLILLGVDADRLRIISYGEEKPLVDEHNESAWAKNRRCEFRIASQS